MKSIRARLLVWLLGAVLLTGLAGGWQIYRNALAEANAFFDYQLRQTALTHDIQHIISGFGPNHGGEIALLNANMQSMARYFHPELFGFFNRVQTYLKAKTIMKDGLHYPEAMVLHLEAEYQGAVQGRNWKYPILLADWRAMVDWQIADIREEIGITPVPAPDLWADTNRLAEDQPAANDDAVTAVAAE